MVSNKTKKTVIVVLGLLALIQLLASIVYGSRAQWFRFGLSLGACVITLVFYTGILLAFKIDTRFNEMKKLLEDPSQSRGKGSKVAKENEKSSAEG